MFELKHLGDAAHSYNTRAQGMLDMNTVRQGEATGAAAAAKAIGSGGASAGANGSGEGNAGTAGTAGNAEIGGNGRYGGNSIGESNAANGGFGRNGSHSAVAAQKAGNGHPVGPSGISSGNHSAVSTAASAPARTARCTASDVLRWSGLGEFANDHTDRMPFAMRRIRADVPLLHEGMPFEHLYFVCAGSLKCVQVDSEGYEQVLGFALHGDTVGLDGMGRGRHASGAVALEDSSVAVMPYRELAAAAHRFEAIERLMQRAIGAELLRRGDTQYLMSAASSEVRVARFLLHFAQRQNAMGYSDRRIRLRMTRRDIASHLGVAHETVSRALTTLSQCGCIAVTYRDIEILDARRLQEIQRVTRGTWRGLLSSAAAGALAAARGSDGDGAMAQAGA